MGGADAVKALGALLVLISAGSVWASEIFCQRREVDVLRRLAALLARMEAEIRGRRTPLPRLLRELSREETRLSPALEEILRGLQAGKALPGLLGGCADRWGLSPWCRTAMEELGCALGGDEGESGEALAFARHRILEELEEKRQSQGERERRSTALCFSGAALVILLLL